MSKEGLRTLATVMTFAEILASDQGLSRRNSLFDKSSDGGGKKKLSKEGKRKRKRRQESKAQRKKNRKK